MSKGARIPQPVPLTITFHDDSPLLPGVVWANVPRTISQSGRALQTVGDIMAAASAIRIENHPNRRYQAFVVPTATELALPLPPSTLLPADGNIFLTLRMVPRQQSTPQPANQDVKGSKRGGRRRIRRIRRRKRRTRKNKKKQKRRHQRSRRRNH